jgi:protein kinase X
MIDTTGHAKIIDLGFAKRLVNGRTFTLCGTPEYLAPEVLREQKAGYGKSVDYWGIGILAYELLAGFPPFYDADEPKNIYSKILRGVIEFPDFFSLRAKDLIIKLLNPDPERRLGIADVTVLLF